MSCLDDVRLRVAEVVDVPVPRPSKLDRATLSIATDDLGRWGYALDFRYRAAGHSWPALMHFCDPHPSRQACLEAGLLDVEKRVRGSADRDRARPVGQDRDLFDRHA